MDYSKLSMHELFRLEAENQVSVLSQGLLNIEKVKVSERLLEQLMRAAHSLKGAARIVGIDEVVTIAHLMEDCFVYAQQHRKNIHPDEVDVLLRSVDVIQDVSKAEEGTLQEHLAANAQVYASLAKSFSEMKLKHDGNIADPSDSDFSTTAMLPESFSIRSNDFLPDIVPSRTKKIFKTILQKPVAEKADRIKNTGNRFVRVDSEKMNRLMGLSGELAVESRWLQPYSDALGLIKRDYAELSDIIEGLRESILQRNIISSEENLQFSRAQHKLSECRNNLTEKLQDLADYDRRNTSLSSRLYNEIVTSRMRPFSDATQGLQRTVRDLSRMLDKNVTLEITGLDVLIDRDVIDVIKSPLVHLVRNAIDHGIEPSSQRIQAGKPRFGKIRLSAMHRSGLLVIKLSDDGGGINLLSLKKRILEKKLSNREMLESLHEAELLEFIYLPDFSTRDAVSEISGRGVGLDVVYDLVSDLRGTIRAENREKEGLTFILQLPVRLSVVSAIIVNVSDELYAFPKSGVLRLESVCVEDITIENNRQYLVSDTEKILLVRAAEILEQTATVKRSNVLHIVIIGDRANTFGILVDEYSGESDLSVQSLEKLVGKIQHINAAALNRDGEAVLIFDIDDLIRSIVKLDSGNDPGLLLDNSGYKNQVSKKHILVIDDSLTVREIGKKLLGDSGYSIDVAVDGIDGWNQLRRMRYDLLITDVDMPRMDGIELVNKMKQDPQLCGIPVMIVSYKDRSEDRQRGMDAGADYYLAKGDFDEKSLLDAVTDLIGKPDLHPETIE